MTTEEALDKLHGKVVLLDRRAHSTDFNFIVVKAIILTKDSHGKLGERISFKPYTTNYARLARRYTKELNWHRSPKEFAAPDYCFCHINSDKAVAILKTKGPINFSVITGQFGSGSPTCPYA